MKKNFNSKSAADKIIKIEKKLFTIIQKKSHPSHVSIASAIKDLPVTVDAFMKGLRVLPKELKMYINHWEYFEYIEKLIKTILKEDLKLYIAFRMIHSRMEWLGNIFYKIWFKLYVQKIYGLVDPPSRESVCIHRLIQYLPGLFGKYYYNKAFDSKREQYTKEMIQLLTETMEQHISHTTWMNNNVEKAAIIKLNKVITLIGLPIVPETYPFTLSPDDYPTNIDTILSHSFTTEIKKVSQHVNCNEWTISSAQAKAYYSKETNTMVLSAASLQPPFFYERTIHPSRTFGAISTMIGHEFIYGFDYEGRFYDGKGNNHFW